MIIWHVLFYLKVKVGIIASTAGSQFRQQIHKRKRQNGRQCSKYLSNDLLSLKDSGNSNGGHDLCLE